MRPRRSSRTTRAGRPRATTRRSSSSCPRPTSSSRTSRPTPQPRSRARQVTVTWTDVNSGTAATTGGWVDRIRVVNQTTNAVVIDQQVPFGGPLQAGASVDRSAVFRVPDGNAGVGTLQIQITVDTNNGVFEVNAAGTAESNNTATTTVASSLAAYADLVVTDLTVTPGAGWAPASTVTVGWTTQNQGNLADDGIVGRVPERREPDDGPDGVHRHGAVRRRERRGRSPPAARARGARSSRGRRARAASASSASPSRPTAPHQLFENNTAGTGESNNTTQISILSAPDLQVANLATTPTSTQAGGSVTVTWDDTNGGTATPVAGWTDRVVVVNVDTGETILDTTVAFDPATAGGGAPAPGQSRSRSVVLHRAGRRPRRRPSHDHGHDRLHERRPRGERGEQRRPADDRLCGELVSRPGGDRSPVAHDRSRRHEQHVPVDGDEHRRRRRAGLVVGQDDPQLRHDHRQRRRRRARDGDAHRRPRRRCDLHRHRRR